MDAASRQALRHYLVVDSFWQRGVELRRAIDARMSELLAPFDARRFAWELWSVPGQFSQHRTPARGFFPVDLMTAFEQRLTTWARTNLGLSVIGSPPWLSSVTDGGYQGLHRDSPNGHWAFSYGLSKKNATFRGGETQLARPDLLDYFRHGGHRDERAHWPMFDEIPARFDRLVVFDARIPHGVRTVEGPRHLRDGRIAIQGWLRASGCVAADAHLAHEATTKVNAALKKKHGARDLKGAEGLFTLKLTLTRDGRVKDASPIVDTLVSTSLDASQPEKAARALAAAVSALRLPAAGSLIVPIVMNDAEPHIPIEE